MLIEGLDELWGLCRESSELVLIMAQFLHKAALVFEHFEYTEGLDSLRALKELPLADITMLDFIRCVHGSRLACFVVSSRQCSPTAVQWRGPSTAPLSV